MSAVRSPSSSCIPEYSFFGSVEYPSAQLRSSNITDQSSASFIRLNIFRAVDFCAALFFAVSDKAVLQVKDAQRMYFVIPLLQS